MIRKTQWIELRNLIKQTATSYISILIFIMLAVAFFTGIGGGTIAFSDSLNTNYEECRFHDYEVTFPYGFSEEDFKTSSDLLACQDDHKSVLVYSCLYATKTARSIVQQTMERAVL